MQEMYPQNSSGSPNDILRPSQTPIADKDKQVTLVRQEAKRLSGLPTLYTEALTVEGSPIFDETTMRLQTGRYQGQTVTIQQAASLVFIEQRASLGAFVQSGSPFWLPVVGVIEGSDTSAWVMRALPETCFDTWLVSPASTSWVERCRLVRDVAVGLYQRRAIGATHISWDARQLYLDKQGRVQIVPLLSETETAETDDVYTLGQLIWQATSRKTKLIDDWQQGKGLPQDCSLEMVAFIQACTNSTISERPSLKALAKGLDAFWQRAEKGLSDALPQVISAKKEQKYEIDSSVDRSSMDPMVWQPTLTEPTITTIGQKNQLDFVSSSGSVNLLLVDDQTVSWLSVTDPRYQLGEKLCALRDSVDQSTESKASPPALQQKIQHTLVKSKVGMLLWVGAADEDPSEAFIETAWHLWQVSAWQAYRPGDPPPTAWLPLFIHLHPNQSSISSPTFTNMHQHPKNVADFTESEWELLHNHYKVFWLAQGMGGLTKPCNLFDINRLDRDHSRLLLHSTPSTVFKLEESTYLMPHGADDQLLPAHYARFTTDPACDFSTWNGRYQGKMGSEVPEATPLSLASTPTKDLALNRDQLILPVADGKTTLGEGAFGEVLRGTYYDQPVAVKRFKEAKFSTEQQAKLRDEAKVMAELHSPFLIRSLGLSLETPPLLVMELAAGSLYQLLYQGYHQVSISSTLPAEIKPDILYLSVNHSTQEILVQSTQIPSVKLLSESHYKKLQQTLTEAKIAWTILPIDISKLELINTITTLCDCTIPHCELPWSLRWRLLRDISLGLDTLHRHELVHRDLKSLNILLDADGRAKLCDFGLSTLKSQTGKDRGVGTALWHAPEVLQGGEATSANDMYGFAMIACEIATRHLPYHDFETGKVDPAWRQRAIQGQRGNLPLDCPSELAVVIKACWSQDPKDRPTASQVAQVLEGLWQQTTRAEPSPSSWTQPPLIHDSKQVQPLTQVKIEEKASSIPSVQMEVKGNSSSTAMPNPVLNGLGPEELYSLMPELFQPSIMPAEKKAESPVTRDQTSSSRTAADEDHFPIPSGSVGQMGSSTTTPIDPQFNDLPPELLHSLMSDLIKQSVTPLEEKKISRPVARDPIPSPMSVVEFKALLTKSPIPCWHNKQSPEYRLGLKLFGLRKYVLNDPHITQELSCYIEPNGQSQIGIGQPSDPLYPWVERELLQEGTAAQVLLLQGQAGAGKSTFNRYLLRTLWQAPAWQTYRPGDPAPQAPIPLFIPLQSAQVNPADLWDYYHQVPIPEHGSFTTAEIHLLQRDYRFVWIADGYDEIPGQIVPNVYDANQLGKDPGRVKLIISCRSQRVQTLNEADSLAPHRVDTGAPDWPRYRMRYVSPFTPQQTQGYIEKFVAQQHNDPNRPKDWDAARYQKEFAAIPELQTLIDTPFMLWMTLSILPELAKEPSHTEENILVEIKKNTLTEKETKEIKESKSATRITRTALYDRFMDAWFTRQAKKAWQQHSYLQDPAGLLGKPKLQAIKEESAKIGGDDVQVYWLKAAYRVFCLAFAQQLTQAGQVSARCDQEREVKRTGDSWQQQLLGNELIDSSQLREGSPLRESSDHTWSFLHASLLDYFLTTAIAEQLCLNPQAPSQQPDESSEAPDSHISTTPCVLFIQAHAQAIILLNQSPLTPEQIRFLMDRFKQAPQLKPALFAVIERSKTDPGVATASANAATVLNACRVNFSYQDWYKVQLPGADLRYALLAHSDLRGANLRGAIISHAFFYQTNLGGADLRDVRWGEWPRLQCDTPVNTLAYHLRHFWVNAVVYHPHRPWVAVAQGNNIEIWDIGMGQRMGKPLCGHTREVMSVAFSLDGRLLASGSRDATLRLWDPHTQALIGKPLVEHDREITSVAFSPNGRQLVSGSWDKTLQLWDTHTRKPMGKPLRGHTDRVTCVAFSPDGTQLVSGSRDKTLRLWNAHTQAPIGKPLRGHTHEVTSVAFSPDNRQLASGSYDTLRLWDPHKQTPIGELLGHSSGVLSVAFSPNGRQLVSGSNDNILRLWDPHTQQPIGEPLHGHDSRVNSVAFSPDGRLIVSGDGEKDRESIFSSIATLRLWDAHMQAPIGEPLEGNKAGVTCVAFNRDGTQLVSCSWSKTIRLWDAHTQASIGKLFKTHVVTSAAFSPDGRRIVLGGKVLQLWDIHTQALIGEFVKEHDTENHWGVTDAGVTFSPDGKRIVSFWGTALQLWDADTQQALGGHLEGHNGGKVTCIAFSPDGQRIVSGGWDTLRLWDAYTQQPLSEPLRGHTHHVQSVAFSPNGRQLVSGSNDKTLRLWDADTQQPIGKPLRGHTEEVTSVAFSPDGQRIISGSKDKTLRLWDAVTGKCLTVLHWHYPINSITVVASPTILPDKKTSTSDLPSSLPRISEYWLGLGDHSGMISFWAVSYQKARIRFIGMPHHNAMPLWLDGAYLRGCHMDVQGQRLLAQYGAKVEDIVLEMPEEKEKKSITSSTRSFLSGAVGYKSSKSRDILLPQAEQMLDQLYPPQAGGEIAWLRQPYVAQLDDFRKRLNTLTKHDKERLAALVKTLRQLRDYQLASQTADLLIPPGKSAGLQRSFLGSLTQRFKPKKFPTSSVVNGPKTTNHNHSSSSSSSSIAGMGVVGTATTINLSRDRSLEDLSTTSPLSPPSDLSTRVKPEENKQKGVIAPHAQLFSPSMPKTRAPAHMSSLPTFSQSTTITGTTLTSQEPPATMTSVSTPVLSTESSAVSIAPHAVVFPLQSSPPSSRLSENSQQAQPVLRSIPPNIT